MINKTRPGDLISSNKNSQPDRTLLPSLVLTLSPEKNLSSLLYTNLNIHLMVAQLVVD